MKLITAIATYNYGIGYNNDLIIKSKLDLKQFKEYTLGQTIAMGLNTFKSLGCKPLPGRANYVVSRTKTKEDYDAYDNLFFVDSLDEVPDDSIVIGGEQLYRAALLDPRLTEMRITMFLYVTGGASNSLAIKELKYDTVFPVRIRPERLELKSTEQFQDENWSSPQIENPQGILRFEVGTYALK